ncbi:MAG TPA: methyltransferase domain-containing protein [Dongiaceae bacterium]|nr:methyltransferase domain-containing protein [Dongiaceae bacterium]
MRLKEIVKPFIPRAVLSLRHRLNGAQPIYDNTRPLHKRHCPLCGYHGFFGDFGRPPRIDALCPQCGSLERHRLFWLWFKGDTSRLAEPVLHFAPEPILMNRFRKLFSAYSTADLFDEADLKLDIENIALEAGSVKTVICNHVLEHVCDRKALAEIYRVLSDDGCLVCSVPIVEGWDRTYENDGVTTPHDREVHFGQSDHVRFYGRDFRDRLRAAGFANIEEVTAEGRDVIDYGLWRGEKFFLCRKS